MESGLFGGGSCLIEKEQIFLGGAALGRPAPSAGETRK